MFRLWVAQLYQLTVLWPAWLLTPEGRKTLFSRAMFWKLVLGVIFLVAIIALAQTLPMDMALIGAGDVLAYIEVASIVWVSAATGLLRSGLKSAARAGFHAISALTPAATRHGRPRAIRRRPRRSSAPANDDSGPGERWAVISLAA